MFRSYFMLRSLAKRAQPDAAFRARLHERFTQQASNQGAGLRHTFLHPFRLAFAGSGALAIVLISTGAYAYQSTSISPTSSLYDLRETLEDAESSYVAPIMGNEEEVELQHLQRNDHEIELIDKEMRDLEAENITVL